MKLSLLLVLLQITVSCIYASQSYSDDPRIVDPWVYEQRLGLYQYLLNASRYEHFFGDDNLGNIYWGLPLQFEWQMVTGRLMANGTNHIAGISWWGCMNYYLSVLPYMGAVRAGFAPELQFLPPLDNNDTSKFCVKQSQCNETSPVVKWSTYWTTIAALQKGQVSMTLDDLSGILWDAHTETVAAASPVFQYLLTVGLASSQEAKFVLGWTSFVPILGSVHFNTNYTTIVQQESYLPYRMLEADDIPGYIKDMTKQMNAAAALQFSIYDAANTPEWKYFLEDWNEAMAFPSCREAARSMLVTLFSTPAESVYKLLWALTHSCR